MNYIHRLDTSASSPGRVTFSRTEMRQLLSEYSRRVAAGEWRDYAIDYRRDRAVFSVFRHTAEVPLYAIEKFAGRSAQAAQYRLSRGRERLKQGGRLPDVINAIERRPHLVAVF